jgi:hypothetical protein
MSFRLLWMSVLLLLLPASMQAQLFWVAPYGSDVAGDGSFDRPWASISGAMPKLPQTGGTLIVREGIYTSPARINRKFTNWLIIRSEYPLRAQISVAQQTSVLVVDAAFVEVSGFDINRSTPQTAAPLAFQVARSSNIILRNNVIHDSRNNDVLKLNEASQNLLIIGNVFYNQEGPAGQHIDSNGCTNVTIRDNIFFNDFAGSNTQDQKITGSYIVVKNSGEVPDNRHTQISNNIFLNWQGGSGKNFILLGEDGKPFYEAQDVLIENNLLIGNSQERMRSAFGAKGVTDVLLRNNTFTGDLPSSAFAIRLNQEGRNLPNRKIRFVNNIWSDPTGTMDNFSDGMPSESTGLELWNNVYWNGGTPLPGGSVLKPSDDSQAIYDDALLGSQDSVVLPRWTGYSFLSGSQTIRQEFERLVNLYGSPAENSSIRHRSAPEQSPKTDILDRIREDGADLGAVQFGANPAPLRVLLVPFRVIGGSTTELNQVILSEFAGVDGVTVRLTSSNPDRVQVPESIFLQPGTSAAAFRVSTTAGDPVTVTISAQAGDLTRSADIELTTELTATLSLAPSEIVSGISSSRNLLLVDVPSTEDETVKLSSSRSDLVTVPETVRIAAGHPYSDYFTITTKFAAERTPVTITANWKDRTATSSLDVIPSSFTMALRTEVTIAGAFVNGNSIMLDQPAGPGGTIVTLSSARPDIISVPESILIPEGENIGLFGFQTYAVGTRTAVKLKASVGNREVGSSCDIVPVMVSSISGPISVGANGTGTYRVILNAPALEPGVVVKLEVRGSGSVPAEVMIPAGQNSATFQFRAGPAGQAQTAQLAAIYLDRTTTFNVAIEAPRILTLYLPVTSYSGTNSAGSVTITGIAPPEGITVQLSTSSQNQIELPESVMVAAGTNIGRFTYRIKPTAVSTPVVIAATLGESKLERATTIMPAEVASLSVTPATVTAGSNLTVGITLRGLAPENSMVDMTSSAPEIIAPQTIPTSLSSGFTRVVVPVKAVTEEKDITITVSYLGSTQSKTIKVKP